MQGVEHDGYEELTLLELVLQLHGEFGRILEPIRLTPLQAGVLLFIRRHANARVTDAAAALRVRQPTLIECGSESPGAEVVGHPASLG